MRVGLDHPTSPKSSEPNAVVHVVEHAAEHLRVVAATISLVKFSTPSLSWHLLARLQAPLFQVLADHLGDLVVEDEAGASPSSA
jgi:hypothetical protein